MAHEIEEREFGYAFAWAGDPELDMPWHKLGNYVGTGDVSKHTMAVAMGMMKPDSEEPWLVEKEQLYLADGTPFEGAYGLLRDFDRKQFSVVGEGYHPIQGMETLDILCSLTDENDDLRFHTGGCLRGGQYVFALIKYKDAWRVNHNGNDTVESFLLSVARHGDGAFLLADTTTRVVCMNTLRWGLDSARAEFKIHHRANYRDRLEEAKVAMGLAVENLERQHIMADALAQVPFDQDQMRTLVLKVAEETAFIKALQDDATERQKALFEGKVDEMVSYHYTAPGADGKTAWSALNGFTYHVDHMRGVGTRADTPQERAERRIESAWLGDGQRIKDSALANVLDMADVRPPELVAA